MSAHVVPKGPSSAPPKRDPFDEDSVSENESTALESGWEDEASTTVAEQGDVADKIRSISMERAAQKAPAPSTTNMLDEPTVDDRRANGGAMAVKPPTVASTRLLITAGNDKGMLLVVNPGRSYTIGRGIDNDLVLTDIAVSRKHFDLKYEGGAWVLVDRRSGNGTLINGNIEDNAFMLANGDVIEIGNTTFRFEMPTGLPRSHPASGMETPATASMDASMDAALDAPRAKPRGPALRRPLDDDDDDDDDEQSTVAGKPLREEALTPPQAAPVAPQPPVRSRPATMPPPTPPAPPPPAPLAARMRPVTAAPPVPSLPQPRANPGSMPPPYSSPSAGTQPMQAQVHPFNPQSPTILGDAMGIPIQAPGNASAPQPAMLYNPGYPVGGVGSGAQPAMSIGGMQNGNGMYNSIPNGMHNNVPNGMHNGMHPSLPQMPGYGDYGRMPPAYAQQRPAGTARKTKLVLGAAGLAIAAAILTVVIIQVAAGDEKPTPAKKESKDAGSASPKTKPAATTTPTKPSVEPIKSSGKVEATTTTTTAPTVATTTTTPTKPTVEPIKTEPAKTEPAKTEPAKIEPAKTEPAKTEPAKTEDPRKKEREAEAAERRREEAAAKKEREAAARREREEAAARKREEAAARKREEAAARKREEAAANKREEEPSTNKRVGADTSGVKDKADGLYRGKNFSGAASALKAAAKGDDASELKSLAAVYENLGKAYNVGMAPGTPPKQAFDLLIKAKNFDNRAGGAFTSDINAKLADIAPKAAVAFMADKDYVRARNAVAVAESGGKGNSSTQGVKSSLESAAGKLFKEAQAEMGSDEKAAREKLKQVQQMVDSKSQWHQKAGKLLSGGG